MGFDKETKFGSIYRKERAKAYRAKVVDVRGLEPIDEEKPIAPELMDALEDSRFQFNEFNSFEFNEFNSFEFNS